MRKELELYKLSPSREEKLWNESIFVFDASALLDFYFLPKSARVKVFNNFFEKILKDRLWIPGHVYYEYSRNREKIIKKPIIESYQPVRSNIEAVKKQIKALEDKLTSIKNSTKKDDKHPFLPQQHIDKILVEFKKFEEEGIVFDRLMVKEIVAAEEEIEKVVLDDDISKAIESYFKIGKNYTFDEILKITKEGKHRYEFSIPPGYKDANDKEKKGTQIFGDLIIWKQILDFAKENKKPIIFVCNDVKEDWCYKVENNTEKRIESPREELIKEIYDFAGVEFWMYTQPQFLHNSVKFLKAIIDPKDISVLRNVLVSKDRPHDQLVFDCARCGHTQRHNEEDLDLDYEVVGGSERNMGAENHYKAEENFQCENCGSEIIVTFNIWEYPEGVHNYDDVEIDGAELRECFTLHLDFHDQPYRCGKCGREFDDENHIGICDVCEEEYNDG